MGGKPFHTNKLANDGEQEVTWHTVRAGNTNMVTQSPIAYSILTYERNIVFMFCLRRWWRSKINKKDCVTILDRG